MALSNPASGTALSVTSTPDADLSSALGILAMQDPSIPTPGECHIDRCAIETLIQVAESLDNKGLCSLARASKRYTEAAQDVLYRVVDLRSDYPNREHKSTFDRPTKSGLAVFLCTIKQKPHLATKVKDLWFLPRSRVVKVCEKKLACDLLARLTELRSLTITALDDCLCSVELAGEDIFEGLPTPLQELVRLPCFSKLTSIYLSHGFLDWAILTLPTLHTLCIGTKANIRCSPPNVKAPNITSLKIEAANESYDYKFRGAEAFLDLLPNVHTLTLGSHVWDVGHPRFPQDNDDDVGGSVLGNTGSFDPHIVQTLLSLGRSVENLIFTYAKLVRFGDTTTIRLEVREFEQLRRIHIAECGLVDSHNFQRPAGSSPSQLLPRGIRTLVITHPRSPGPDDGDHKSKLTSWLGELTRTDFPDLERVEVVCSVGYGDGVGFKQRLEQSAEVRSLETIGVAVVVRKE